jgi:hypothetical protein
MRKQAGNRGEMAERVEIKSLISSELRNANLLVAWVVKSLTG